MLGREVMVCTYRWSAASQQVLLVQSIAGRDLNDRKTTNPDRTGFDLRQSGRGSRRIAAMRGLLPVPIAARQR
jgi:hypothetical protein